MELKYPDGIKPRLRRLGPEPDPYMTRKCSIALFVLFLLPGCAEIALGISASNSVAISKIQQRQALNTWSDEKVVSERTTRVVGQVPSGEIETLAVVAPAWSYGGIAVRVASPVSGDTLYQPELQVSALTDSGVHLSLFINNEQQQGLGVFMKEWSRFPLDAPTLDKARKDGLTVRVECEVGEWVFRMSPTYYRGYETKLEELRTQVIRANPSALHQPASQ